MSFSYFDQLLYAIQSFTSNKIQMSLIFYLDEHYLFYLLPYPDNIYLISTLSKQNTQEQSIFKYYYTNLQQFIYHFFPTGFPHSNIIFKNIEFIEVYMDPSKPEYKIAEESQTSLKQEKKQKSLPKFNRKADARLSQKKRSIIDVNCYQHRISYISPGKNAVINNFNTNSTAIQSPNFQDVMHKFTINNEDLLKLSKSTNFSCFTGFQTSQKQCNSDECKRTLDEKQNKIKNLKSKLQKMKERCDFQKDQIATLKLKIQQFDVIQAFLLQRETFISQIMETNISLNQNLAKSHLKQLQMEDYCNRLIQQKSAIKQQFEKKILQYEQMLKRNNEQTKKIKVFIEQSAAKKKKSKKRSKQNNENINGSNMKRSNIKSAFINPQFCQVQAQFLPQDLNAAEKTQLHHEIQPISTQFQYINSQSAQEKSGIVQLHNKKHHWQNLINNLQQKIRYSYIQIDVLKKIRLDSSKIMNDNQHLKFKNRKLLNRISYLTRNFSRRGDHSDSSLQLSLSPKTK